MEVPQLHPRLARAQAILINSSKAQKSRTLNRTLDKISGKMSYVKGLPRFHAHLDMEFLTVYTWGQPKKK